MVDHETQIYNNDFDNIILFGSERNGFIALFNNMRTLKFKAKLTITFYAAVNHYSNGHPKAETSKRIEIRQSRTRSVTCRPL